MMNIGDEIVLVNATELRTLVPNISKDIKVKTVIVTKRGKPIAVIEDYSKYEEKKELLDTFEDLVLGYLAKERFDKSKKNDYVPMQKVMKILKRGK